MEPATSTSLHHHLLVAEVYLASDLSTGPGLMSAPANLVLSSRSLRRMTEAWEGVTGHHLLHHHQQVERQADRQEILGLAGSGRFANQRWEAEAMPSW